MSGNERVPKETGLRVELRGQLSGFSISDQSQMKPKDPFQPDDLDTPVRLASPTCYLADFDDPETEATSPDQNPMNKDRLYLIRPGFFHEERGPFYCPGCAEVLGLLEHYPFLKERVSLHYVDFARPRPELVKLLGAENQSCPVLILSEDSENLPLLSGLRRTNGFAFVEGAREIGEYFALVHASGSPF